jgi:hypothetical protein
MQSSFRFYIFILILCFAAGVGLSYWASGFKLNNDSSNQLADNSKRIVVGDFIVSDSDVDTEYGLLLYKQIQGKNSLDLDLLEVIDIPSVREEILLSLIERKALYTYIIRQKFYTSQISQLQKKCADNWTANYASLDLSFVDKPQMKTKVCELNLISMFLKQHIYKSIVIDEEKIQKYFIEHQQDFQHPKQVQVRHLLVAKESLAKKLRFQINTKNFISFVRKYSIAPDAKEDGLLPPYSKGQMPSLFNATFTMKKGTTSPLISSAYGFHFFLLENIYEEKNLQLVEVREEIFEILLNKEKKSVYKTWLDEALERAKIKIL